MTEKIHNIPVTIRMPLLLNETALHLRADHKIKSVSSITTKALASYILSHFILSEDLKTFLKKLSEDD